MILAASTTAIIFELFRTNLANGQHMEKKGANGKGKVKEGKNGKWRTMRRHVCCPAGNKQVTSSVPGMSTILSMRDQCNATDLQGKT